MKLKKLLASVSALAIAMSTMMVPVAADDINGGVVWVDKTVYEVTLPTTASQNFYLDPEGLISAHTASGAADTLLNPTAPGTIYGATAMTAINNSSVTVKLEATLSITGEGVSIETTTGAALNATAPAVCMTTTFAKNNAYTEAVTLPGVQVISSSAVSYEAVMAPASYSFYAVSGSAVNSTNPNDYKYVMDTSGSAVDITLGGNCAKDADWSTFKSLKVVAVFKFYTADTDRKEVPADGAVAGAPTIANGTYSRTASNNTYAITNLGSRTISSIYLSIDGSDGTYTFETPVACYSISGNNLVIDGTKNTIGNGAVGSARYLLVTFSDGKTAKFTINVTA